MRRMISGMFAAAAVMAMGATPAMACGFSSCSPCGAAYVSPCAPAIAPTFGWGHGCNTGCGGWGYERLAEPTTQYYYVNQGPTYTGPGAFAPYPTYREDAVVTHGGYGVRPYGYGYRPYRYGYGPRYGYLPRVHYGYAHRYAPYRYGPRPLRRYY
ncbi:hypothetical protein [Bradyrhizobium sp.]|uniref:hypothetical protein n=1 Tax=Bradyrhizobium sp. TaxID=376 RepID=UPI00238C8E25|nr:hypothetical protein [Bradyrhizobium sp.]MDE2377221.1 hypothetical protein [Bradyrhizobium sp.]